MKWELTPEAAKFVQDCLAARHGLLRDAVNDSDSGEERAAFLGNIDLGARLALDLQVLRSTDLKERTSGQ